MTADPWSRSRWDEIQRGIGEVYRARQDQLESDLATAVALQDYDKLDRLTSVTQVSLDGPWSLTVASVWDWDLWYAAAWPA